MKVKCVGRTSNSHGIGAKIFVSTPNLRQVRRINAGDGVTQNSAIAHFGLGLAAAADVRIEWPSGEIYAFSTTNLNREISIDESVSELE